MIYLSFGVFRFAILQYLHGRSIYEGRRWESQADPVSNFHSIFFLLCSHFPPLLVRGYSVWYPAFGELNLELRIVFFRYPGIITGVADGSLWVLYDVRRVAVRRGAKSKMP
jgi:hypothetical protein